MPRLILNDNFFVAFIRIISNLSSKSTCLIICKIRKYHNNYNIILIKAHYSNHREICMQVATIKSVSLIFDNNVFCRSGIMVSTSAQYCLIYMI